MVLLCPPDGGTSDAGNLTINERHKFLDLLQVVFSNLIENFIQFFCVAFYEIVIKSLAIAAEFIHEAPDYAESDQIFQLGDVFLAWRLFSLVKSDPRLRNVPENVPKLLALSLVVE